MGKLLITAIVGIAFGLLAAKALFLQGFTLIPWGLAAVFFGYISSNKKEATINGGIYGLFLGFIFMIAAYNGRDPIISKIPFFVLMGIISAVCSIVVSLISYYFLPKQIK